MVDTQNPNSSASSPAYSTSNGFSVSYSAADPVKSGTQGPASGLDSVVLYVKTPNASGYALAHHFGSALASDSFSYTASDGDGNYLFYTVATDKAGNAETAPSSPDTTTLVDTQQPNSSASSPAYSTSNGFSVSYSAADPVKSASLVSSLGLHPPSSSLNPPTARVRALAHHFGSAPASDSFSYTASDGDGNYLFYTVATDKAGNAEAAPSSPDTTTLVDTQQPNTVITFPTNNSDYNTATYTAGCSSLATATSATATDPVKSGSLGPASGLDKVEVSIKQDASGYYWDGSAFVDTSGVETWKLAGGTSSWSYNLPTPPEGTYTVHSRATDKAGNVEATIDVDHFNQ